MRFVLQYFELQETVKKIIKDNFILKLCFEEISSRF